MKCTSDSSETSMSTKRCSLKLRILTLVLTTADLINERATPTMGMSHAIISPIAIFSTYIFVGIFVVGAVRQKFASKFLQTYALLACSALHMYLSIVVFRELRRQLNNDRPAAAGLVLNGVLPMLLIFVLVADLIVILLSDRTIASPVLPGNSRQPTPVDIQGT